MSETHLIRAYSGVTRVAAPLLPLWLKRRALKGKEDPARQQERFGQTDLARPKGQLFWMHGASVGEVIMMLPLIDKTLKEYPNAHVLVTSGTVTSAALLETRLPKRALHQYVPLDTPKAVAAFLDHWQPDMAIWAESEIWPNLILQTKARNIPMALVNARMSEKSIQGWGKRKASAQSLFGSFHKIIAANEVTARGLTWLLNTEVEFGGNLKDAAPILPVNADELEAMKSQIGNRPVWCAASTHKGEEDLILAAHAEVKKTHPNALLILALRHPERRDEVLKLYDGDDLKIRSINDIIEPHSSVYLFDTIGEMGLAYSLSSLSFVCGSLVDGLMGHNPLEPARLGNAVLTGPHISSFADIYMPMFTFEAAARILSPTMVGTSVSELFSAPETLAKRQAKALAYAQSRDEVLEHVWQKLAPVFPKAL